MSEIDPDLMRDFLVEGAEILARLDAEFVELEKNPCDAARLKEVFRGIHTIKGTSSFMALTKLERVAHAGENLLSQLRDGALTLDGEMTSALLSMVDAIRSMVGEVEASATDGDETYESLVQRLEALAAGRPHLEPAAAQPATAEPAATPVATVAPSSPSKVVLALAPKADAVAAPIAAPHADSTVRVDVQLLDRVMNLVGELVLARNQIIQCSGAARDATLSDASQRLNLLTTELHESVLKTRMQAIGTVWSRFPRIVRDLSLACGKKVDVELDGSDTELDRTIIEAIKDPLTHLVRNSLDHGLETPAERVALGKSETGRLRLDAYHEGGQVNVEVSDDGAGINLERVRAKALERGVVTSERLGRMSDHEVMQLIFVPGFSTAPKVTNLSGRGVGMDVVKTNIERIGGTVELQSQQFKGTTITIKLPLTLAIVPALVVEAGGERFAIPQVSLLELVRLEGGERAKGIERVHGVSMYRLRGNLLPLAFLDETLGLSTAHRDADTVNIVVLQVGDRQFGLVVDNVRDAEEIVVKPLGKALKGLREFSGATIMGDGGVALILDVVGLASAANMATGARGTSIDRVGPAGSATCEQEPLLALRVGQRRLALPLKAVARLEALSGASVERSAGRSVVQYRGHIMPLIDLCTVMGDGPSGAQDLLQVVVFTRDDRSVGLVVDQILDIVLEYGRTEVAPLNNLLMGSLVLQGRVTDLLNVPELIAANEPSFFESAQRVKAA